MEGGRKKGQKKKEEGGGVSRKKGRRKEGRMEVRKKIGKELKEGSNLASPF